MTIIALLGRGYVTRTRIRRVYVRFVYDSKRIGKHGCGRHETVLPPNNNTRHDRTRSLLVLTCAPIITFSSSRRVSATDHHDCRLSTWYIVFLNGTRLTRRACRMTSGGGSFKYMSTSGLFEFDGSTGRTVSNTNGRAYFPWWVFTAPRLPFRKNNVPLFCRITPTRLLCRNIITRRIICFSIRNHLKTYFLKETNIIKINRRLVSNTLITDLLDFWKILFFHESSYSIDYSGFAFSPGAMNAQNVYTSRPWRSGYDLLK